jgi:hypothetical protein
MYKKVLCFLIKINFVYHLKSLQRGWRVTSKPRFFETLLLNDAQHLVNEMVKEPILALNLYLYVPEVTQSVSLYRRLYLFYRISKTRGLTRWLCNNLCESLIIKPYELSRRKLFTSIFLNWRGFSNLVLGSIVFTDKEIKFEDTLEVSQLTDSYTKFSFSKNKYYKVDEEFHLKKKFSKLNSRVNNLLFVTLVKSDSNLARAIFNSSEHLKDSKEINQIIDLIPDFAAQLNSVKKLNFVYAKFAGLTFDQRLNEVGINSFDTLSDVEIWHQRFIIKNDQMILIDDTCSPNLDFVAGHWQYLEQVEFPMTEVFLKKHLKPDLVLLEEAIYLIGRADENWYHLILDTLPRYLFMGNVNSDVPVLIRSDLPKTSLEFLTRIIGRQIIQVDGKQIVKVRSLHYLAARSTTFDSHPPKGSTQIEFSPRTIQKLQNYVFSSLPEKILNEVPERISFQRNSKYRQVLNYKKIHTVLSHFDFVDIQVNENFFRNQVWIFRNANFVVSQGGAIFANMIFMKPGSRVMVLRSTRDLRQSLWKKLAFATNIEISQFFGVPTYFGFNKLRRQHTDYIVSSKLFEFILRRILAKNYPTK